MHTDGQKKIMDTSGRNQNIYNDELPATAQQASDAAGQMTNWENEPTISQIKEDIEFARQENQDQTANVKGWLDIRNTTGSEGPRPAVKGSAARSRVQPKLVRKHNEWRYPALSEPLLNTDRLFKVDPRTEEDTEAAKQNQTVLNWQFDTQINKVGLVDRLVRTLVDEGSAIIRVGWDRKTVKQDVEVPVYDYYPIEVPEQLELLDQLVQLQKTTDPQYERVPDEIKAAVEYFLETGVPVYAVESGTSTVRKDVVVKNQPSAKIIKVDNFFVDPACEGVAEDAQYMAYTYEATQSTLKKRRIFKNLEKVDWQGNAVKNKIADQDHTPTSPQIDSRTTPGKSKVLVHEYWGLHDIHKTGEMVPVVVTFIGNTIIQMDKNPFPDDEPPFIIIPYMPILESVYGEADASLLQDNQRIIGAVTRGVVDLMARSANAQTGYAKDFLDPVNRQRYIKGEHFEFNPNNDPRLAIQQMKYPEIPNSALQVINMNNSEAEGLTGVKGFSSGITGESFGRVARGMSGAMDAAKEREISIIRRVAWGLGLLGKKVASMNAVFLEDTQVVRITNKNFVEISREELRGNFDLKVEVSSAASDEAKSQDLGFVLQTIGPDMEQGLRGMIIAEICDLKRMPTLADRIRNYQPQPDPMAERKAELELRKLEADVMLEEARAQEALAKARAIETETNLDLDGTKHRRTVEAQGAQARGNRDLEVAKSLLNGETPAGNIEAAVGFNELIKQNDTQINPQAAELALPVTPDVPVEDPSQGVAIPA